MRTPLALQVSPAVRRALLHRAIAEGIDPDGPGFSEWAGDVLLAALPAEVFDLLRNDDAEALDDFPPDAATPLALAKGAAYDLTGCTVVSSVSRGDLDGEDDPGGPTV